MDNIFIEKINQEKNKLITYAQFIELALYHPLKGYYMRDRVKIGKDGDFITTSNVSPIFGAVFSKWFLYQVMNNGIDPYVCELGAGNGRFAKAFLDTWKNETDIPLSYYIVETSPYHKKLQEEILPIGEGVYQVEHLSELKPFHGLVFSNELFDAFPVHVIEKQNGQLFEVMIGWDGQQLIEKLEPLHNPNIFTFLETNQMSLLENQRIEIPLQMEVMLNEISNTVEKGIVATIDYGYTNEEWQLPEHRRGSLRGYYKHQMISDVILHPGEMDITTHIHFDHLIKKGEELGLHFLKKQRQDEFLVSAGILKELEDNYDPNPFSEKSKRNRAIRSLIMPGMSSYFHIVLQEKGTEVTDRNIFEK
ncbi:class I SAM-dependent methyltransferase [Bacillus sp. CGMCC 1.16607]|uniref:class I SAM-dependent methyltransferase n=1 Tax=Bacillus sp. CGMCC 1.16607 TaxID=3351842 RepID=UPI0036354EB9